MKNQRNEKKGWPADDSHEEGSVWELLMFAVFFIVVFSAVARAETPTAAQLGSSSSSKPAHLILMKTQGQSVAKVGPQGPKKHATKATLKKKSSAKGLAKKSYEKSVYRGGKTASKPVVKVVVKTAAKARASGSKTAPSSEPAAAKVSSASAQSLQTTQAAPATAAASGPDTSFSGSVSISTARTLDVDREPNYSGSYGLSLGVSHKPSSTSAGARLSYSQEYTYERADGTNGSIENPSFNVSKRWKEVGLLDSVSLSLASSLAGNKAAEKATFRGSLGPSVTGSKAFGKFNASQGFGYTHSFYEYDIRADGTVNAPHSLRSSTSLGYGLTEKLSLSASYTYSYSISFQNVGRASQTSSFVMSYGLAPKVATSAGVSTTTGTLEPDGQTYRVKFFDSRAAVAFFDLIVSM